MTLAAPLLAGAGWLLAGLPAAIGAAHRFEAAPLCAEAPQAECRDEADYQVVGITRETGRSPDNRILAQGVGTDQLLTVHLDHSGRVLGRLGERDLVRVASWHGEPVSIAAAGHTQRTATSPTDGEFLRLGGGVGAVLLTAAAWFAGLRLRGGGTLPDPDHHRLVTLAGTGAVALPLLGLWLAETHAFPVLVAAVITYPLAAAAFWYHRRTGR